MEQRIIDLFKSFKNQNEISEKNYGNLYASGSKPGILYVLVKIHKALEDGIPTFCPILFAVGTTIYKLAKFCDKLLKPITINEYAIKDSLSKTRSKITFHKHSSYRNHWPLCGKSL